MITRYCAEPAASSIKEANTKYTLLSRLSFQEVWIVDFEFSNEPGERPRPVCVVAKELRSGRLVRLWRDQMGGRPPFSVSAESLYVGYFACAEFGCHLELGWSIPLRILDLFAEFRVLTNFSPSRTGYKLSDALTYFGLDPMDTVKKEYMQQFIAAGGPWTHHEQHEILNYCQEDVEAEAHLLERMAPWIDLPYALLRGRYMAASARMEHCGIPIDIPVFEQLRDHEGDIKQALVDRVNPHYDVYDEELSFREERFFKWLAREKLRWPVYPDGSPDLRDQTFKLMAMIHPQIVPLRELRKTLSKMHLDKLQVGKDGFNRCILSPFQSKTGRNQPSNSKFIFGSAAWLRHLIKPPEGYTVVYLDFEQQEFGVAAALSQDPNMLVAYLSGDSYLAFAKQAKAAPSDATKASHEFIRDCYKTGSLSAQYGITFWSLAAKLNQPGYIATQLLEHHHRIYRHYWKWTQNVIDYAKIHHFIETNLRWRFAVDCSTKIRTLLNFPMQAHGAEMLRLALCAATESGLLICAPVHDAVLLLTPTCRWQEDTARLKHFMQQASALVLGGFELRVEAKEFHYPNHFVDKRGIPMWNLVTNLIRTTPWQKSTLNSSTLPVSYSTENTHILS
jgi:hypothetical protein